MEVLKETNFKEAILQIKVLDNSELLVVDSKTTVRFLDKDTLKVLTGFRGNIVHNRYKNNVLAFCSDASYFASLSSDCQESRLYNVKTKKMISKVSRHHGEVSCVGIDPLNRYMFSGGDDGKTFVLDIKSGKLLFTLPVHVDTLNDIAFSSNGQWVATASYDKKISVFNLAMMIKKEKLQAHYAPVMKLHFLSKHRLFSVDKKNSAIIWDYYKGKVLARLDGVHDDVTQVTVSSDDKFLFLGTQLGYILVYELDEYKLLSKKYIKLSSSITVLTFDDETQHLILGTEKGDVVFYDIYEGLGDIKELLQKKEFTLIEKSVEKNPLLKYTKIYQLVESLWEKTIENVKIYLQRGDKESAINTFKYFKNIPSKNSIIKKIMLEFAEFDKFTLLAQQGKLALAYSLVNKHPLYKESKIYKNLESGWKKAFVLAQKYAIDPKGAQMAKDILAPYRGVIQKTKLIQELLTKSEIYKRFRDAIAKKDFKVSFELIKQNSFLKEFSDYDVLISYADALYIKSHKLIQNGDTHAALKVLRVLVDFSDFTAEAKELMQDIENKQNFFNAIKANDIESAYNFLYTNDELQNTEDGKKLQHEWNDDITKANKFALEGSAKGLDNTLSKYMKISSKHSALANIYGLCYMTQLENAIDEKKEQIILENAIGNYILCFGLQDQIESLFNLFKKNYPKSKFDIKLQTKGSIKMWRPSLIVESILD